MTMATTRARIAIAVESARSKAACFADKNSTFAEIECELREASALIGPKSFINDTVVFERRPIEPGEYDRVTFEMVKHGSAWIDIINPHLGMTADELREAAHLFNQIAEYLEQQP